VIGKLGITRQDKIDKNLSTLPSRLRIDKDDAWYIKAGKGLARIIISPALIPFDFVYNRTRRKYGEQGTKLKELHKDNKALALQRVAEKNINVLQENIKMKFQERLIDKNGNLKSIKEEDRDKIKENRRNRETDDLATTLKMIEKRIKKDIKDKENKYIEEELDKSKEQHAFRAYPKALELLEDPQVRETLNRERERLRREFKDNQKSATNNQDTVLEKLIKREYAEGRKDFTLKYIQELAQDGGVDVKQALFGNAKDVFEEKAGFSNKFKNAFDKAVLVASDSVATSDSTAVTDTENVASVKDEPKSNFDKNRIIASIMYDSIANKEFNNLKNQFHIPIEDPKVNGKTKIKGLGVKVGTIAEEGDEGG
jgi:hypothetical protein